MIKTSALLICALAVVAQAQTTTNHEMANGVNVLESGITVTYKTQLRVQGGSAEFRYYWPMGSAFGASGNVWRHVLYDKTTLSYFGYDVQVTPVAGTGKMLVAFGPLTVSAVQDGLRAIAGDLPLNAAPAPVYPAPQTVSDGDTIALDLMTGPDGKERITDYIQFTAPATTRKLLAVTPRDFSIDDGPVRISGAPPSVRIDGKPASDPVMMLKPRNGATLWFYFPGAGRYILSLAPHEGFAKAGTLRGPDLAFHADGRHFEIHWGAAPTSGQGAWNLYLAHDANFRPEGMAAYIVGGVDRLENLLPKRL